MLFARVHEKICQLRNLSKICGKLVSRSFARTFFRAFIVGAFYYARLTGQISVELIKGKWNDIVRKKQNFQPDRSVPFTSRPKFRLLFSEVGLETRIFESGTRSFVQTGPPGSKRTTSGGGPLFPGDFHLDRSVSFVSYEIKVQEILA